MPSKSKAQARFMEAIKRDPKFAKEAGVPQSVGRDFVMADAGRKLSNLPQRVKSKGKR